MRISRLLTYGCICLLLSPAATATDMVDFQIKTYDERFSDFIDGESRIEILASELGWAEGPVWAAVSTGQRNTCVKSCCRCLKL
jgi:hypothetical protein